VELSTLPRWKQWVTGHPALVDAAWGTAFVVASFVSASGDHATEGDSLTGDALGVVLLLIATVPYFFRRKSPVAVFAISTSAVVAISALGYFEGVIPMVILLGAYTVGARCPTRVVVIAYGFVVVALLGLFLGHAQGFDVSTLLANLALFAAAFLFGGNVAARSARLAALEERALAVSREHEEEARRAVADERLRIAQELHDVVAHSMGVIAVQAGAGMHVIDKDPAEAKRSLEAISSTSRSTLTEIRRLLGVLRDDEGRAGALAPAPGLDDLRGLADDLTDAGVPTTLRIDGPGEDVPKGVELTTYRIVQEALTNVLKHGGPGASAEVVVSVVPDAVHIEVSDDGRGIDLSHDGTDGHGLRGMQERVAVYGGDLQAGPRASGGFEVRADLPYGEGPGRRAQAERDAATTEAGP
jgi:signal transduction histidine kinase